MLHARVAWGDRTGHVADRAMVGAGLAFGPRHAAGGTPEVVEGTPTRLLGAHDVAAIAISPAGFFLWGVVTFGGEHPPAE